MSTITLPNIRVSSDLTVKVRLKDGGVAIDWSTLSNIRALIYSDAQRAMAGRCVVTVDAEDATLLVCQYAANKPQYIGVNRIVISATYLGEMKTYDKPALNFVRWTDDQAGQEITISDPDVEVEIEVEDVSSSILQEAVDAAFSAAERADEAAAAAEHMVDIHTGPAGKSAYEVAVEEGYTGTEEEWLASLEGPVGATPDISIGTVTTVEPGTPAAATMTGTPEAPVLNLTIPKGVAGDTPAFTVGEVTTGEPGTPVVVTITGTAAAPVLNVTIPQGLQGNTGSSVAYPYELVNNLTTNDATKGLSAAQGKVLKDELTQLEHKVDLSETGFTTIQKDYKWGYGYVNTSGKVVSSAASLFSQPVLFKAGELLTYRTNSTYSSAVVKVANGNPITVGDTGFVVATLINASTANTIYSYQFTEDTYVVISVLESDYSVSVTQNNTNSIEGQIEGIRKDIEGATKNYANGGWGQNGQNAGSASWYRVLDYIPVAQNDVIVWNPGDTNGAISLIVYDSTKTQISYYGANATTRTLVMPANSAYIRPSFAISTFANAKIYRNGKIVWLPQEYVKGINPSITELDGKIPGAQPIGRCSLRNGTLNNTGNTTAVTTDVVNTCGRGLIGLNITRPNLSGYHYVFGYALTSSYADIGSIAMSTGWNGRIAYQENIDAKTLNILGYPSAVGVAFYIAEKDNDGNANPLRITDFEGYKVELIYFADEQVGIETQMRNYAFNSVYDTTDIDAKCKDFSAMLNNSGIVESFVFMTDPHLLGLNNTFDVDTFKTYIGRLQKYYNMLPVDWMICGGDWLNNGDYQDIACWKLGYMDGTMRKLFKHYFPVLGNHDINYQGKVSADDSSRGDLTHQTLVNLMFRENGNTYYKFKGNNTQFYVFDTGTDWETAMDTFKWSQIDWFARCLLADDAEHSVILQHIFYTSGTSVNPMATNIQSVAGAYNSRSSVTLNGVTYDFSGCSGKIACVIAGHSHFDAIVTEDVSVPVWLTENMMKGSTPTFDLCLINYTENKMKAIRVGSGENREMTLA